MKNTHIPYWNLLRTLWERVEGDGRAGGRKKGPARPAGAGRAEPEAPLTKLGIRPLLFSSRLSLFPRVSSSEKRIDFQQIDAPSPRGVCDCVRKQGKQEWKRQSEGSKLSSSMALPMNEADIFGDDSTDELAGMTVDDMQRRIRLVDNEIRVFKVPFLSLAKLSEFAIAFNTGHGELGSCFCFVYCTGQLGPLGFALSLCLQGSCRCLIASVCRVRGSQFSLKVLWWSYPNSKLNAHG